MSVKHMMGESTKRTRKIITTFELNDCSKLNEGGKTFQFKMKTMETFGNTRLIQSTKYF